MFLVFLFREVTWPPLPSPPCLQCSGLFLNIPCTEVQRVVFRDFPFLRVLLCLSASLSQYWFLNFFIISVAAYIFLRSQFLTRTDKLSDAISITVNDTDVRAYDYVCNMTDFALQYSLQKAFISLCCIPCLCLVGTVCGLGLFFISINLFSLRLFPSCMLIG